MVDQDFVMYLSRDFKSIPIIMRHSIKTIYTNMIRIKKRKSEVYILKRKVDEVTIFFFSKNKKSNNSKNLYISKPFKIY